MYKGAGERLQLRHRVSRPLPTGGYIGDVADETDILPPAAALTMEQAKAEKAQLAAEIQQAEQEITIARGQDRERLARAAGARKAVLQTRQAAVNARIKALNVATGGNALDQAIREIVDFETAGRIFARAGEIRRGEDPPRAVQGAT